MNDDSNRFDVSRRQLIRGAVGVAVAGAAISALPACGDPTPSGPIDAGAVTDYPVGHYALVGSVIVGRDANGLLAYSATCTHEGCVLPAPADATSQSTCPCHASHFDANGDVIQPGSLATRSLAHYTVTIEGGHVMVDRSMVVTDRAARTAVPG